MRSKKEFGPFVHQLNKGGLREICSSQKLRATAGSNNQAGSLACVRAHAGPFDRKGAFWTEDKVYLEFMTDLAPDPGTPPWEARWYSERLIDGHLHIRIIRVLMGSGAPVPR